MYLFSLPHLEDVVDHVLQFCLSYGHDAYRLGRLGEAGAVHAVCKALSKHLHTSTVALKACELLGRFAQVTSKVKITEELDDLRKAVLKGMAERVALPLKGTAAALGQNIQSGLCLVAG